MTGKSLCEMRGCVYISTQIYGICPSLVDDRWVLETTTACSNRNFSVLAYPACAKISYKIEWRTSHYKKDSLREESLGMPQPAVALSITNTMNPHFFLLHPYGSCSEATSLTSFDLLNLEEESLLLNQSGRTGLGGRRRGSGGRPRRNAAETRLATRKRQAAGTAPGTSAQHAEVDQQTRTGQARVFFASAEPLFPLPSPSLLPIPSFPHPPTENSEWKIPNAAKLFFSYPFSFPRRV